jgi:ribonuclease HI
MANCKHRYIQLSELGLKCVNCKVEWGLGNDGKTYRFKVQKPKQVVTFNASDTAYIVNFDGACQPRNPGGFMGWGAVIYKSGLKVWSGFDAAPKADTNTNNVAEYKGLIIALDWLRAEGLEQERILIRGDSKLVIRQCFGHWGIKSGPYVPFAKAAKAQLTRFTATKGLWIPREENREADALSTRGVKALRRS